MYFSLGSEHLIHYPILAQLGPIWECWLGIDLIFCHYSLCAVHSLNHGLCDAVLNIGNSVINSGLII